MYEHILTLLWNLLLVISLMYKTFFVIAAPLLLLVYIYIQQPIHTQQYIYLPYTVTPEKVYKPLDMVNDAVRMDTRLIISVHTPANTDPLDFMLVDAYGNRYDQSLDSTLHKINSESNGTLIFIVHTNIHDFKLRYKDEYETAIHI